MFTGIIEEIGKIQQIIPIPGGKRVKISSSKLIGEISVNDSVCVNGVCLTATKTETNGFWADAVGATLEKTTFNQSKLNQQVNLELSLKFNDRLGGHLVQGHVNGIGIIKKISNLGDNYFLKVDVPEQLKKYLVDEGSITIDGISLTIAELHNSTVGVSIIPHTWYNTNLQFSKETDMVNIETDVLAKYVEKFINKEDSFQKDKISETWLKEIGY
jgi:riboflavin synthase